MQNRTTRTSDRWILSSKSRVVGMRKWESIVFGKFVEGKLGGVHIVANNGRHLLVVLSHNSVGVFPHIWQTLPAVILSQRLVVLILQVEVLEICQVLDAIRHVSFHGVIVQIQIRELGQISDVCRDCAGQEVVLQPKASKRNAVGNGVWNLTAEFVAIGMEFVELGKRVQSARH